MTPARSVGRRGFALPVVLSVAAVLAAFVFAVFQYQSQRVWITGATVNDLSALAAAEAGVGCVLAEIQHGRGFATHELRRFDADGEPVWGGELRRPQALATRGALQLEKGARGTYRGAVGSPPYQAHFRVRVGTVPEPSGASRDAAGGRRNLFVEALGFRQDPTRRQDRAARVRLLVERSDFTEFLLYDGEWTTLGMGSGDDPDEANVFADGRIYGRRWVHLGDIAGGTRQHFVNLSSIRSGGPVKTWDRYRITFQGPAPDGNASGFAVDFHPGVDSDGPSPLETAAGRILDGAHGGEIPAPRLDAEAFRRMVAEGRALNLDQTRRPARADWDSYPEFDGQEYVEVDLGLAPAPGRDPDDGGPEGWGAAYPGRGPGLVFSTRPLVLHGAPDKDLTVICTEDVFLAGDFNARRNHRQDYRPGYRAEGIDGGPGVEIREARYYQYVHEEPFLDDAGQVLPPEEAGRRAVAVISFGRIWRDYRLPGRGLGNELVGLLAYEVGLALASLHPDAQGLSGDAREAKLEELALELVRAEPSGSFEVVVPGYEGGAPALGAAPGAAPGDPPALPPGAYRLGALFPVSSPDARDTSRPEFKVRPSDPFGDPAHAALVAGRVPTPHYWSDPRAPWYWTRWGVSEEVKAEVNATLNRVLGAARGRVTWELLWGPEARGGLVHELYDHLLEDEARYAEHRGMGFFGGIPPAHTSRLALANAPQRLYELVRDEPDGAGEPGRLSDRGGQDPSMQEDRLWMPQVTVNSMLFSSAPRNDTNVPGGQLLPGLEQKEADPTRVDRRFMELGNPRSQGLHYLSTLRSMRGQNNIRSPFVQRIRGSQVRFAQGPVREPKTRSGFYWPPIRRRIYDPDLLVYPPPGLPSQALVKSWEERGATAREFERF